ncbi:MAG TPA: putative manganese transporter [Candidatus Omnitrophota bacterium]|nr:putative manganese transporter [Candidatus Omnitrophota bacterium]
MQFIAELINDTVWFLALVFVMLLWADYINTLTRGKAAEHLKKHPGHQYFSGTFLGSIPGCFGSFINVSLYTHRLYSFGALLAGMIATTGDEGFFMLALFPQKALLLIAVLALLGLVTGWIFDRLFPDFEKRSPLFHELPIHGEDANHDHTHSASTLKISTKSLRWILSLTMLLLVVALSQGWIHHPEFMEHDHAHSHAEEHTCQNHERGETWFTIFALLSALWIFIKASPHYLEEHIGSHIIKHHLPKFALWTAGTLLLVKIGTEWIGIDAWLSQNLWQSLFFALLIGLLPVSGPHIAFTILFSQGAIPFSILLANSIVQSGHGVLPLLPYPKRDVLALKGVKLILGLLIGGIFLAAGY